MNSDHRRRRVLGALAGGMSAGLAGCTDLEAILPDSGPDGFDVPEDGEGVDPVDPTGDATLTPSASEWATFGGDGTNTGATAVSASDDPLVHRWTAEYPDDLLVGTTEPFAAIVAGGRVFTYRREVSTTDGVDRNAVVALDGESGDRLWTASIRAFDGPGAIPDAFHAGTVVDGTLYVCSSRPGEEESDAVLAIAVDSGEREWTTEIEGEAQGSPAVVDGVMYVSGSATVYALDAATGEKMWAGDAGSYTGSVATDGDRVIAVPGDRLVAFDAKTGELLWETELPSVVNDRESPVLADGLVVYVHEYTGFAVDAATGDVVWQTDSEAVDGPKPAVADDVAVFIDNGDGEATVRALALADGSTVWETTLGTEVRASPVLTSDRVYLAAAGQTLYGLDVTDGSVIDERWYRGPGTTGEPAVTEDRIFVGHTRGVTAFARGDLDPLPDIGGWVTSGADRRNSRRRADATPPRSEVDVEWSVRSNDPNRPVVAHGLVVVGDRGSLRGIEADPGALRWRRRLTDTSSFPTTSPVAVGDLIYAIAPNGRAVAVRPEDGSIAWEQDVDGEFFAPMTAVDDLVYAVARNGAVYGLDPDDGTIVTTGAAGGEVTVAPAAGQARIFVSNGGLSAIDTSGNLLWGDTPSRFPVLSPSVFGDGVVAAVNDGTVRAYEPTGRPLWRADVYDVEEGVPMFPTAIHEGNPIVAGYGTDAEPPVLAAIDGETGTVSWRVELDTIETEPVVGGGLVWLATGETLGGFDPGTGERVVSTPLPSDVGFRFNLVPIGDRLFGVDEGTVYSLR